MTKELGYGVTPIDISIQNWAYKLAKAHIVNRLGAENTYASPGQVTTTAKAMVQSDPKWIELGFKKVMKHARGK